MVDEPSSLKASNSSTQIEPQKFTVLLISSLSLASSLVSAHAQHVSIPLQVAEAAGMLVTAV